MKRLILTLLVGCAGLAGAAAPYGDNIASFTLTNDSAAIQAAYLDSIVVAKTSTNGTLVLFNSSWTSNLNTNTFSSATVISSMSLGTVGTYSFNNTKVRGVFYVIANNSSGVTIIYKK